MNSNPDKKLEILDIEDFNVSFDSLFKHISNFRKLYDTLNLEYINKISGTINIPKNTNYYLIRDSIFFRFNSILFHFRLLQSVQINQYKTLNKEKDKISAMHKYDLDFLDQQFQLFDSIIFHTVSLFDYLGNLVGLICIEKTKMKWDGVMNSIKDSKNPFSKSESSIIFQKLHFELVDKLYNYRSELIHDKKASGGCKTSYNLYSKEMRFIVLAPNKFCNRFRELKLLNKEKDLSINYVLFWLIEKSIASTIIILESIIKHANQYRKTSIGSDFIYFIPKKE